MENITLYIFLLFFNGAIHDVVGRSHNRDRSWGGGLIIGGQDVSINDYPYQAHLLGYNHDGKLYPCGGSILAPLLVLTAAHCLVNVSAVEIRVGSSNSDSGGQFFKKTSSFFVHPEYGKEYKEDYDIAFVGVSGIIYINDVTTSLIKLPEADYILEPGTQLNVSGWGYTTENGFVTKNLRAVTIPVTTDEYCQETYPGSISPRMFCAGVEEGGIDSCQGDSGGPAVVRTSTNEYLQLGIVSWGEGCGRPGVPGVYTNVAKARGWIKQMTGV